MQWSDELSPPAPQYQLRLLQLLLPICVCLSYCSRLRSPQLLLPDFPNIDSVTSYCKKSATSTCQIAVLVSFILSSKIIHEVYEDTVKRPYVPQGSVEPSAVGVEKLEFILPDNGMTQKLPSLFLFFLS